MVAASNKEGIYLSSMSASAIYHSSIRRTGGLRSTIVQSAQREIPIEVVWFIGLGPPKAG